MLSDPTIAAWITSSTPVYTVGTNHTFRKIANGKFTSVDGLNSADTPAFFSVRQKARKSLPTALNLSDFSVRYERHYNVGPVNGVVQADVPLVVEVRLVSYPSLMGGPELQSALNAAAGFTQTHLLRLQSGEGI